MNWVADPGPDQKRLHLAYQALTAPPEAPSYGPCAVGLEIGGGPAPKRLGYIQFDAIDWSDSVKHSNGTPVQYTLGDARQLPFQDGQFEHVFASNLLEHFAADQTTAVLTEWARVLQPLGALELVVPDAMGILRDYFSGSFSWNDTAERLLGSCDYEGNQHYTAFTRAEFSEVFTAVPELEVVVLQSSHSGGGVHAIAVKSDS